MAETHELRLKIDAAAAKRGSREFTAAVDAVKRAVRELERDSTGAFTKLRKNLDSVSKSNRIDIGINKADINTLNAFAKAQSQIVSSTTSSNKGIKTLVSTMRGLSDSYGMARKTSDAFAASILKTNSGLKRQIQLASQARSAVRQVRTAPASGGTVQSSGPTAANVRGVADAMNAVERASRSAGAASIAAMAGLSKQASLVMRSQRDAASAALRYENVQLSSAAAMRRSENEAIRLAASLRAIGDNKGATEINQSLIRLKANLKGGVESSLHLRKAMDQFSQSTAKAKASLANANAATAMATAENKRLTVAQRSAAASAKQVEAQMRSIAGATNATSQAFSRATGNMRGLENAFSGTFQVGSAFRAMLGSITLGTFTKGMFEAGNALDQFRVTMEVATGSVAGAAGEMDYIDDVANRLGTNLKSARDNYSKFAISADIAGVSTDKTRKIFESVSTAMAVLGKGTEDQNLAFLALEQMMSKGTVSSEELRRQLGERLPGAVNIMAQALGVTTAGLQDMLKAGEISSSDALPKFADELMKRFGPGLQKATQRAGYSLGTLSNEITKFQESVAQSGFMQVLSQQFSKLTEIMRSSDTRDAAQSLGEGFAYMAEKGGDAAIFIIENIEKVGQVVKAVAAGIVVRQSLLMANALVTAGQQFAAFMASVAAGQAGQTAAEIATAKHTAALHANTLAITGNATAAKAGAASVTGFALAEERAAAAALRSGKATQGAGGGFKSLAGAASGAAGMMAVFSRGLSVIAPVAGIALTALMLLPSAMTMFGDETDDTASKIDAAIRRSGSRFEELGDSIQETASNAALATIITDLNTLDKNVESFVNENARRLKGLQSAADKASGGSGDVGGMGFLSEHINGKIGGAWESHVRSAAGVSDEMISAMSRAEKNVFVSMTNLLGKVAEGTKTFLSFQSEVNDAIVANPGASGALTPLLELTREATHAELSVHELRKRLVEVYGTDDDRLVKNFASMATEFVRTGKGLDDLREQASSLAKTAPTAAEQVKAIFEAARVGASTRVDYRIFDADMLKHYDNAADKIDEWRTNTVDAHAAASSAMQATKDMAAGFADSMNGEGLIRRGALMSNGEIEKVQSLFEMFQNTGAIALPIKQLTDLASAIDAPKDNMVQFRNEALATFSQLSAGNQTYAEWEKILGTLSRRFSDPAITEFSTRLLDVSNTTGQAVMTASQLHDALSNVTWPNEEAERAAMVILNAAYAQEEAEQAAYSMDTALRNGVDSMNAIGSAAAYNASRVDALRNSLATLAGAGASLIAGADKIIADMELQVELKAMPIYEREAHSILTKGQRELEAARNKAMDDAMAAGNTSTSAISATVSEYDNLLGGLQERAAIIQELALKEYNTEGWVDPNKKKGGGGGKKGAKPKLTDDQKSAGKIKDLYDQRELQRGLAEDLAKTITGLEEQANAQMLLANGMARSSDEADRMAQAMRAGISLDNEKLKTTLDQVYAYEQLNEAMTKLANDPVKEWMKSVPSWTEAAQTIEMEAIGGLSSALSNFIQTGKLSFSDLASSIAGSMADILADQAVSGLMNKLGRGTGTGLAGLGGGGQSQEQQQIAAGGQTAATLIGSAINAAGEATAARISAAMTSAGTTVKAGQIQAGAMNATQIQSAEIMGGQAHSQAVSAAITTAGQQHASSVAMAGATAGASSGMLASMGMNPMSLLMMGVGMFSEGGISSGKAPQTGMVSPAAFRNAPQFKNGTANTSGIPAILHDNEAVVPLSGGRKIPVDMGNANAGGANVNAPSFTMGDVIVNVEGGDGSGMSPEQAKAMGSNISKTVEAVVETKLAYHLRYGGMLNPRGQ